MRRIGLAVIVALILFAAPIAGRAQQAGKIPRVAVLTTTSPEDSPNSGVDAFRQGLRELGYIEGQTIVIDWRWGRARTEQFPEFAADAVRRKVDVIVAANSPAGRAATNATKTIPIIIPLMTDPIAEGFAATLAHPGSNVTGLTIEGGELTAKRLQLLQEALPNISRLAIVTDTSEPSYPNSVSNAEHAARTLGVHVQARQVVSGPGDLAPVFTTVVRERVDAVFLIVGTMTFANRAALAELALKNRLPMMCGTAAYVRAGCLMGYSASVSDLFRRAATYVDKILKGAKPADLPVEQPTKFELVFNLKTAKALGLTISQSVLGRADQIME
jgi:putative ABC transport system substrate-binding protein